MSAVKNTKSRGRVPAVLATLGTGVIAFGGALALAPGAHADPPGNNGAIKVTEVGEANTGPKQNMPHVQCPFDVEFYGFDTDAVASVSFEVQAPTTGSVSVSSGSGTVQLDSDGVDAADFDGEETYALSFTDPDPHPQQGYHVKVTAHVTGSQGADTKYKVFWVEPCEGEEPPPVVTEPPTTPPLETTPPRETEVPPTVIPPTSTAPTTPVGRVLPSTFVVPTTAAPSTQAIPTVVHSGIEGDGGESSTIGLGLGLLAGGGALIGVSGVLATRRRGGHQA